MQTQQDEAKNNHGPKITDTTWEEFSAMWNECKTQHEETFQELQQKQTHLCNTSSGE